jgi:adenylosuccinate synthase
MTDSRTVLADVDPDADARSTLEKLGLTCAHSAVVGLQWGDEGKGQIVDLLTKSFDVVARYNGGNNAGHSVHIGDQKFALHLIPSGIMYPDKINVIGNGVVVNPEGILKEIDGLRERGVKIDENLKISDRAHVVFEYHKTQDKLYEMALAKAGGDDKKIGTTGRGIGPCYADKALRSTAVRMSELIDPDKLRAKLGYIVPLKNVLLGAMAQSCGEPFEPFDADALFEQYNAYAQRLRPHVCDTTELLHDAIDGDKLVLFEGANANLLDVDFGTYPFVTSSNCSSLGIYPGTGVPGGTLSNVIGIAKLYTSRVGGGPFPTEIHDELVDTIRKAGNEFGTTTGRPRRCGWIDTVAIRFATKLSGVTALACTGLSVLCGLDELNVCVGYNLDGKRINHFPGDADALGRVEPIYETLPGFKEPIDQCRSFDQLPAEAKQYVAFVEKQVGVPIRMVCVGRRRDQILVRS